MLDDGYQTLDGAEVARSVRSLARRARWTLAGPADESEVRELCDEIEDLQRLIDSEVAGDLGRWLASLRRRVEALIPTAV